MHCTVQYMFLNTVHFVVNYGVRVSNLTTQTDNLTLARYYQPVFPYHRLIPNAHTHMYDLCTHVTLPILPRPLQQVRVILSLQT
jgi:hypothetical protein